MIRAFPILIVLFSCLIARTAPAADSPPNLVIIVADDLGYGDLGCYGHPTIRTPHLDAMAAEGVRFTDFYAGSPVCTPSRAALLTGRLAVRSGMANDKRRVLFPNSTGGLPQEEVTIAEALKGNGYATACVGKWHLGHLPRHLPMRHGFDTYFGIPYSNDMDAAPVTEGGPKQRERMLAPKVEYWNVPLMRDEKVVERPAQQPTLTRRYTGEAIDFISRSRGQGKPFFVYLAYAMPHVPLFASPEHAGRSPRGLYGDVVEEIDANVGRLLALLRKESPDTLVIFTSDNGPWLVHGAQGGSAGLLREGKGSTWEGGMRVPCIAWWPQRIRPQPGGRREHAVASVMDLFPTALELAGAEAPTDRPIDGRSLLPQLRESRRDGSAADRPFFYYRDQHFYAVRKGPWKAHYVTRPGYGPEAAQRHDPPLLFHLGHDPSERFDVAAKHADVVAELAKEVEAHRKTLVPVESQLD